MELKLIEKNVKERVDKEGCVEQIENMLAKYGERLEVNVR